MSPPTTRLCHHAAFHATKAVTPRFVHKSVHNAARGNCGALSVAMKKYPLVAKWRYPLVAR
jgi:hypothetical protein